MDATSTIERPGHLTILRPSQERLERLGEWFAAEYEPLLRFAYFVSGDRSVAEDLVQETFVRLYRAERAVEEEGLRAYARRTLINLHRSAWRRRAVERRHEFTMRATDAVVADHAARAGDEVWEAMKALPPRMRACVTLRYYEDLSEKETAAVLGLSVGAVKKQTHRAMARLREMLGDRRDER